MRRKAFLAFRVYPRVCGGTGHDGMGGARQGGLSPRVRGNREDITLAEVLWGSIPACAGEPTRRAPAFPSRRVYPRVCGGTLFAFLPSHSATGLSPRVRGNPRRIVSPRHSAGSIPACAGEPSSDTANVTIQGVYPRVCGGTVDSEIAAEVEPGLSPRVRGNRTRSPTTYAVPGSIPACAGEPSRNGLLNPCLRVYPRVCGGTWHWRVGYPGNTGLSPRVRGNRDQLLIRESRRGSIPACAGEPPAKANAATWPRVYPRVCGGTSTDISNSALTQGLSPRVRGNRESIAWHCQPMGSIPACAGEPGEQRELHLFPGVYPRVCGGTC